jgi:NAD(P)-dependent dehydrogenase (short-subunit alcohol dehydrogenase family)
MNSSISTPLALVTGARGGIGRSVLTQLRRSGHALAAVGRSTAPDDPVDADLWIAADTCTFEGAQAAILRCQEHFGRPPNLLAHCVGNTLIAPLHRSKPDQIRAVLQANLDSAIYMLKAWIEGLEGTAQPGAAVMVSSVVARIGVANHEAIAAAKGGIEALARSAAATYAARGLRINAVAPGMTETPMTAGMLRVDSMREGAGRQYPLGGVQTAEQVAEAITWLLSDAASRITGQVIAVDGGFSQIRPLVR